MQRKLAIMRMAACLMSMTVTMIVTKHDVVWQGRHWQRQASCCVDSSTSGSQYSSTSPSPLQSSPIHHSYHGGDGHGFKRERRRYKNDVIVQRTCKRMLVIRAMLILPSQWFFMKIIGGIWTMDDDDGAR